MIHSRLESNSRYVCHKISPTFMKPECSLQASTTERYPEPDESTPYHHSLFIEDTILIISPNVSLGLEIGLLTSDFPTKILYVFLNSFMCVKRHAPHLIALMISGLDNVCNSPGYFVFLPSGYHCDHS